MDINNLSIAADQYDLTSMAAILFAKDNEDNIYWVVQINPEEIPDVTDEIKVIKMGDEESLLAIGRDVYENSNNRSVLDIITMAIVGEE